MIYNYLYSNGVFAGEKPYAEGVMKRAVWSVYGSVDAAPTLVDAGEDVFRLQCASCHTISGYNGVKPLVKGWSEEFTYDQIGRLNMLKVGGTLAAAWYEFRGRLGAGAQYREMARRLWGVLLLYGKFFYPASVLTGRSWFAVIPLLIIGYYLLYVQVLSKETPWRPWAGLVATVIFLAIAAIYVSTMGLTTAPEVWKEMYAQDQAGRHFFFSLPRWLHVVLGSTAMAGAAMAVLGHHARDEAWGALARKSGLIWLGASAALEVPVGLWYLFTLSETARSAVNLIFPVSAVVLGLLAFAVLLRGQQRDAHPLTAWLSAGCLALSVVLLSIQRHLVRQTLLARYIDEAADWKLQPQWNVFILFALLLVAAVGLIAYMARRYFRALAQQGEAKMARSAD